MSIKGTVVVTGGAGYIGAHTCKALASAGYTPVAYDLRYGHRSAVKWGPLEVGDIADVTQLASVFDWYKPVIGDYIHVTDLVDAHLRALKHLESGGKSRVYNLGNGNGFSVKEIISAASKVTSRDIPWTGIDRRPGDPPVLVGSTDQIEAELGWVPDIWDIESIIETAWCWHKTLPFKIL